MATKKLAKSMKPVRSPALVGLLTGFTPTKKVNVLRRQSGLVQSAVLAPEASEIIEAVNRLLSDPATAERARKIEAALGNDFELAMRIGKECGTESGLTAEQMKADPTFILACAERKLGLTKTDDKGRTAAVYIGAGLAVGIFVMMLRRKR